MRFAEGVSGGFSTDIRRAAHGDIPNQGHGALWNVGRLAGVSTSFLLGFRLPGALRANVAGSRWAAGWDAFLLGYNTPGAISGLTDGRWEWSDAFNVLHLISVGAPVISGIKSSLNTIRKVNGLDDAGRAVNGLDNVDDLLLGSRNVEVEITGPSIDFFHGSSRESVENIINNGLDTNAARRYSGGGRVNRPGSFFSIETSEPEALQLAYEFGLNRVADPNDVRVLVVRVPESTIRHLESGNLIIRRPIAGVETTTETIFRPGSFDTLNQVVEFPEIIVPPTRGGG